MGGRECGVSSKVKEAGDLGHGLFTCRCLPWARFTARVCSLIIPMSFACHVLWLLFLEVWRPRTGVLRSLDLLGHQRAPHLCEPVIIRQVCPALAGAFL